MESEIPAWSGDETASGGVGGRGGQSEEPPPVVVGANKDDLAIREGWNSNGGGNREEGSGDSSSSGACPGLAGGGGDDEPSGEGRGIEPESGDRDVAGWPTDTGLTEAGGAESILCGQWSLSAACERKVLPTGINLEKKGCSFLSLCLKI